MKQRYEHKSTNPARHASGDTYEPERGGWELCGATVTPADQLGTRTLYWKRPVEPEGDAMGVERARGIILAALSIVPVQLPGQGAWVDVPIEEVWAVREAIEKHRLVISRGA